eukprot:2272360-Rhodomonas_salina.3
MLELGKDLALVELKWEFLDPAGAFVLGRSVLDLALRVELNTLFQLRLECGTVLLPQIITICFDVLTALMDDPVGDLDQQARHVPVILQVL